MKVFQFLKSRLFERSTRFHITALATIFGGPLIGMQVDTVLQVAGVIAGAGAVIPDNK